MGRVGTIGYRRNKYVEVIRGLYPKRFQGVPKLFLAKPIQPNAKIRVAHISYFCPVVVSAVMTLQCTGFLPQIEYKKTFQV